LKESEIPKQFFNTRVQLQRTSAGIFVPLPDKWCSQQRFGHPAEIDTYGFPHVLLIFPACKRRKLSEVRSQLLMAVSMIEFHEKMKEVMKDAEKATKKLRKFTRSKRKR